MSTYRKLRKHFGVSAETIQSLNPALQSSVINGKKTYPQRIRTETSRQQKTPPELIAAMPSKVFKKQQTADLVHRVQKGDTAMSIARYHGISVKSLIQANKLDKYATIKLQQKLTIPKSAKKLAQSEKDIIKISPRIEVKKVSLQSNHSRTRSLWQLTNIVFVNVHSSPYAHDQTAGHRKTIARQPVCTPLKHW